MKPLPGLAVSAVALYLALVAAAAAHDKQPIDLVFERPACLKTRGFDPGEPGGIVGPATRATIRAWQLARGHAGSDAAGFLRAGDVDALMARCQVAHDPPCTGSPSETPNGCRMRVEGRSDEFANRRSAGTAGNGAEFVRESESSAPAWPPGRKFRDCDDCPEMVVVRAGTFEMGSPPHEENRHDHEGPQHWVTIPERFAVGVYEITFAEWDACHREGGCSHNPDDEGWGRGDRPVVNVGWEDAKEYVGWLAGKTGEAYRLPSESEWEYAARGGSTTRYWWGDAVGWEHANCIACGSPWDSTAPVGWFAANDFGLHDVHGNVQEWVEDCEHDDYHGAPSDGSSWTSGGDCDLRVLRGGSWFVIPRGVRSASRGSNLTGYRDFDVGFRVARTLN